MVGFAFSGADGNTCAYHQWPAMKIREDLRKVVTDKSMLAVDPEELADAHENLVSKVLNGVKQRITREETDIEIELNNQ